LRPFTKPQYILCFVKCKIHFLPDFNFFQKNLKKNQRHPFLLSVVSLEVPIAQAVMSGWFFGLPQPGEIRSFARNPTPWKACSGPLRKPASQSAARLNSCGAFDVGRLFLRIEPHLPHTEGPGLFGLLGIDGIRGTKRLADSGFRQRFLPNTPLKISDRKREKN